MENIKSEKKVEEKKDSQEKVEIIPKPSRKRARFSWGSKAASNFLLRAGLIKESDQIHVEQGFDEKLEEQSKSEKKSVQTINAVMDHPIGAVFTAVGLSGLSRLISRWDREDESEDLRHQAEQEIESRIYKGMIDKHKDG